MTGFGLAQDQGTVEGTHITSGGIAQWAVSGKKGSLNKAADVFSFAKVVVEVSYG